MGRLLRLLVLAGAAAAAWVLFRELLEEDSFQEAQPAEVPWSGAPPETGQAASGVTASSGAGVTAPSSNGPGVEGLSKAELYEQAKRLGIEGRSKMSKAELARAIAAANGG